MKQSNRESKPGRVLRGALVLAVAGLGAGCSSDVTRFSDGFYTGSIPKVPPREIGQQASQPYEPDTGGYSQSTGGNYSGSVSRAAVRPVDLTATSSVSRQTLPAGTGSAAIEQSGTTAVTRPSDRATNPGDLQPARSVQTVAEVRSQPTIGGDNAAGTRITLREGETLFSLSRRYGVPAGVIAQENGIADPSKVMAGQVIVIPANGSSGSADKSASSSISKTASSEPLKKKAPEPEPNKNSAIEPRTVQLREPTAGNGVTQNTGTNTASASQDGGYTVASGDTLWSIANKHGITVSALRQANGIDKDAIRVGQKLKIPVAGESGTQIAAASPDTSVKTSAVASETNKSAGNLPSYTPPRKTDQAIEEADKEVVASTPNATGVGTMRWPARGRIISNYGDSGGTKANDGIDISLPRGTPVKAAENGIVIYAGNGLKEFGNTVLVRHEDGLVTVYGHASELKVARGERVRRGQEIALSGMTGEAESPRLHFEVRKESQPVNPLKYLE